MTEMTLIYVQHIYYLKNTYFIIIISALYVSYVSALYETSICFYMWLISLAWYLSLISCPTHKYWILVEIKNFMHNFNPIIKMLSLNKVKINCYRYLKTNWPRAISFNIQLLLITLRFRFKYSHQIKLLVCKVLWY